MTARLRILLLQPAWDGLSYRRKIKVNEKAIHPLALGVVAALSGNHEVTIVDEAREKLPVSARGFDLVGISVNTFNAPRAYRYGDLYRSQGLPVVFGGAHTSLMPEECLQHADSIIVGDAETTWPRLLDDLLGHQFQSRYFASTNGHNQILAAPRRDLFRKNSPHVAYGQLSRGCSNKCRFCYLQYMPQHALRLRDVSSIYDELRAMPQKILLFVDDNVFCEPEYTKQVLRAITPLRKRWWIQAPTDIHQDDALIPLMAESGCYCVSIGFQTSNNLNNQNERILQNRVEHYGALVKSLHQHGILVDGTFIFGFDGDTAETFAATEDLIRTLQLDTYTFYFLTPYPGTDYFKQFESENRILHRDWSRFDWDHVVLRPKQMTTEELMGGVEALYRRLDRNYFLQNGLRRFSLHRRNCGSAALLSLLISTSWSYYRSPILRP